MRYLMCYFCKEPFSCKEAPNKCIQCSSSIFLNLEAMGIIKEDNRTENDETEEKELDFTPTKEEETQIEKEVGEIGVFSGFLYSDDPDAESDFFGSLPDSLKFIDTTIYDGKYKLSFKVKDHIGFNFNICHIVVSDYRNNSVLTTHTKKLESVGYKNGKVIYGIKDVKFEHMYPLRIRIYTDLICELMETELIIERD